MKTDPTTLFDVFRKEAETMKRNKRNAGTIVEVFRGKDGAWYFRTKARNRQVGDVSEGYGRKSSAIRGATRWHPGVTIHVLEQTEKLRGGKWVPDGVIVDRVIRKVSGK